MTATRDASRFPAVASWVTASGFCGPWCAARLERRSLGQVLAEALRVLDDLGILAVDHVLVATAAAADACKERWATTLNVFANSQR